MELIGRREYRVATYHVGRRGAVRPSAIMGFLEDAAGDHAASWKVSVFDLMPRGLTWVLSRYHLKLLEPLHHGDLLEVATWPSGRTNLNAIRDFEVVAADGSPVALASTSWAVIDLAQKRCVAASEVLPEEFLLPRRVFGAETFSSLPRLESAERQVELPVMRRDLDINDHVNHIVYLEWALEAIDASDPSTNGLRPIEIEISYRAEARLGDRVVSAVSSGQSISESFSATVHDVGAQHAAPSTTIFLHLISNAQTGAELARVRTFWGPRGRPDGRPYTGPVRVL